MSIKESVLERGQRGMSNHADNQQPLLASGPPAIRMRGGHGHGHGRGHEEALAALLERADRWPARRRRSGKTGLPRLLIVTAVSR